MIPSFSPRGLGLKWPDLDFGLSTISAAGFRCVDLLIRDLVESGKPARGIRRRLDDCGLLPGTCQFPLDWRGEAIELDDLIRKLPPLLEFAAEIGLRHFYARVSESVPDNATPNSVLNDHRRKIFALSKKLEEFGIGLALETVGVKSFRKGRPPLMASLADVRFHLAECFEECPNLGLLLDAFHLHAAGESVEDALGPFANRVFGIHVADLPRPVSNPGAIVDHERALPGTTGQVPVRSILERARRYGCPRDTPVIVESIRCPDHLADRTFEEIVKVVFSTLMDSIG